MIFLNECGKIFGSNPRALMLIQIPVDQVETQAERLPLLSPALTANQPEIKFNPRFERHTQADRRHSIPNNEQYRENKSNCNVENSTDDN